MTPLRILRPSDADEALRMREESAPDAWFYSGGVELVPMLRRRVSRPQTLIDVKHLPEARRVRVGADSVRVGAAVTHWALADSPVVGAELPAIARGLFTLGNPRVRATGTVGGNLASARSESDLGMLLTAYGATIEAVDTDGPCPYPAEIWTTPPRPEALVVGVEIPRPPADHLGAYRRFPRYGAPVAAAVALRLADGVRITVGSAGGGPLTIHASELGLDEHDHPASPRRLRELVEQRLEVAGTSEASAPYRQHLAWVMATRAFQAIRPSGRSA